MRRNGFPVEVTGFIPAPEPPQQPGAAEQVKALAARIQASAANQPALSPILAELIGMLTYSIGELNQLRRDVLSIAAAAAEPAGAVPYAGVAATAAPKSDDAEPGDAAAGREAPAVAE